MSVTLKLQWAVPASIILLQRMELNEKYLPLCKQYHKNAEKNNIINSAII